LKLRLKALEAKLATTLDEIHPPVHRGVEVPLSKGIRSTRRSALPAGTSTVVCFRKENGSTRRENKASAVFNIIVGVAKSYMHCARSHGRARRL
jgi:hypothetical protein